MQGCLGATYCWSVFVDPLKSITGLGQGQIQFPFSLFYIVFPLTTIYAGLLVTRAGPRFCSALGGVLFGLGWMTASLGRFHFGFTLLGIGILGGVGVGLAYIGPITTCIKWFPERKGLVTGIAVAGFGGGAALISQIAGYLLNVQELTPFDVFLRLGLAFMILAGLAGSMMQPPSTSEEKKMERLSYPFIIHTSPFKLLYFAMVVALAAGLAVNANLKQMHAGGAVAAGVSAVSLFALANAGGRILWGWVFDRTSAASAITANLLIQCACIALGPWLVRSSIGLQVLAVLTGINYGGVLVLYASSVARLWGSERVGQIYGLLFSSNIAASLAPVFVGYAFDYWGSFEVPFWILASVLLFAGFVIQRKRATLRYQVPTS